MPNLIPQDIREWMRRVEFKVNDLTRRPSNLVPGTIEDGVDLDGYQSSGRWYRLSSTGTTTALHYPRADVAGILEVYQAPPATDVVQNFIERSTGIQWTRWFNGVTWTPWSGTGGAELPTYSYAEVVATQSITSVTLATLPTVVAAALPLPVGTFLVLASVSLLVGSTPNFAPNASASVKYHLSGVASFTPTINTAGVGGDNEPIGNGGGTLSQVHEITVASPGNLTITAMGAVHTGAAVTVRDVRVQLTALRRLA